MSDDFIENYVAVAASELDLPESAIFEIPNEGDWSFVIEISAVLERSLGHLVSKDIEDEAVRELIVSLSLERKIQLAKDRGLIDKNAQDKFRFVGKIRNKAAHHIKFGFESVFKDLNLLNEYKSKFADVWTNPLKLRDISVGHRHPPPPNSRLSNSLHS